MQKFLQEHQWIRRWARLFKLMGWDITVRIESEDDNPKLEDCEAYLSINALRFTAAVTVNDRHTTERWHNLCHEMVHLLLRDRFVPLLSILEGEQVTLWELAEEQFIHRMTHALMSLHRKESETRVKLEEAEEHIETLTAELYRRKEGG